MLSSLGCHYFFHMALTAAAASSTEGKFVEFTDATFVEGAQGGFYIIEARNSDGEAESCLRVDAKFEGLIRSELDSLAEDRPVQFFVVPDPRRDDPTQFRVALKYYQDRRDKCKQTAEPAFDQVFEPVQTLEGVKDVTATVPMVVWAALRAGHQKQKARFPRFRDYVADVLGRSVALIELG